MENDLTSTLLELWLFYYASAALVGAFTGTLFALVLYRKIENTKRRRRHGKRY